MQKDLVTVRDIAVDFLSKSGHMFLRLHKAEPDANKGQWRLTFDVGVTQRVLKTVTIDDSSGKVVAFE